MKFSDLMGDTRRSESPAAVPDASDETPTPQAIGPVDDTDAFTHSPGGASEPHNPATDLDADAVPADAVPGPEAPVAPRPDARTGLSRLADNFLEDMPVPSGTADDSPLFTPIDDDLLPSSRRR